MSTDDQSRRTAERVDGMRIILEAHEPMLTALRDAVKWCHVGHGGFHISGCGICKPLLKAIAKGEGRA